MRHTKCYAILSCLWLFFSCTGFSAGESAPTDIESRESWWLAQDFGEYAPARIAVLPMENLSLEPDVEKALYGEVYDRLTAKGYIKIAVEEVRSVMDALGIQTAGQLAGISPSRLGELLHCDGVIKGRVDQSGTVHMGVYDALVVSISLQLVHCRTGKTLWTTEQWRAAHRQWHADPFNLLLSFAAHETASRKQRVAWLAQEMLKTLPDGPVQVVGDDLMDGAVSIPAVE
ncbi:MAG: DUF799 family lipoprotein [Desulfosalsimonadaceae bacterium]